MKAVVVGMGSIGQRHFKNLCDLGVQTLGTDIGDVIRYDVDFAVICTPTETHVPIALDYMMNDIPVFIEKPLFQLETFLTRKMKSGGVPNMVACNLRFTAGVRMAKVMSETSDIISFHARISDNHPNRPKYGNIMLQDIHEFDYLAWMFGPIKDIKAIFNPDNTLYDAILTFESGVQGTVHGDMIRTSYERELILRTKSKMLNVPIEPDNYMYVREMEYFMECLSQGIRPMNGIEEAAHVTTKVLEAIGSRNNSGATLVKSVSQKNTARN